MLQKMMHVNLESNYSFEETFLSLRFEMNRLYKTKDKLKTDAASFWTVIKIFPRMLYFYILNKDSNFRSIFSSNLFLLSLTSTVMQEERNSLTENICTLLAWETQRRAT